MSSAGLLSMEEVSTSVVSLASSACFSPPSAFSVSPFPSLLSSGEVSPSSLGGLSLSVVGLSDGALSSLEDVFLVTLSTTGQRKAVFLPLHP